MMSNGKNDVDFVTRELESITGYLGWGDPEPVVLFIGVEEAEKFKTTEEVRKVMNERILPGTEPEKCERYNLPIAKICVQLSNSFGDIEKYPDYCERMLFRKGSGVANINLYPLGKESLKKLLQKVENYKEFFGGIIDNEYIYRAYMRAKRFPLIQNFIDNNKRLRAIICYGVSHWEDFALALGLFNQERYKLVSHEWSKPYSTEVFESKSGTHSVILTKHFSRGISDEAIKLIANYLKGNGVTLP